MPLIWFIKLSCFHLILVIFKILRWLRILVYLGILVSGLGLLSCTIAYCILCAPRDGTSPGSFLAAMTSPRCANSKKLSQAIGILNILIDFYLLTLPLPAVWPMQMPIRKKVGVMAIFLTGIVYVLLTQVLLLQADENGAGRELRACISSILATVFRARINFSGGGTSNTLTVWIVG